MDQVCFNNSVIGHGARCFIIAEAGVNHDGELEKALKLVDAAVKAGADAVKFQTFRAEALVTPDAAQAEYQQAQGDPEETQMEMLRRLELKDDEFREISEYCQEKDILFLSTPFGQEGVDLLVDLNVPLIKIGSGELTNHPFLAYAASTERPIILSTGMADQEEVDAAVECLRVSGCRELILLHCVSSYPAAPASVNLAVMETLSRRYDIPVGFSDHTRGIEIAIGAAALGARVLEKHLTLDRSAKGPDHASSLEPLEFRAMVYAIRNVEAAIGDGVKSAAASEAEVARAARRSLFAAGDVAEGTVMRERDFVVKRPGTGLSPAILESLVGQKLARAVKAGEMITRDMFV